MKRILVVLTFFIYQWAPAQCLRDSVVTFNNVQCYGESNGSITIGTKGGVTPYTYHWSNGQTTSTCSGLSGGYYKVMVFSANLCKDSLTVPISQPFQPYGSAAITQPSCPSCCDGRASAIVNGGTPPYCCRRYSNGQTGLVDTDLCAGTYTLCWTDQNNCSICDTFIICKNTYNEPICIINIDTAINKSEVFWDRTNSPPAGGFGSYNIYKDTGAGYVLIYNQPLNVLSEYIDSTSHPSLAPQSYKISTVDSCGESALSAPHTSIYLTTTAALNVYILSWTPYIGFTPSQYRIFRGPNMGSLRQIDSVPNNVLTYHDTLPPAGSIYLLEAVNPNSPCVPTTHGHELHNLSTPMLSGSFSNGFNTKTLGIPGMNSNVSNLNIYPNPSNGTFAVSYSLNTRGVLSISIINELGQVVYDKTESRSIGNFNEQINLEYLSDGIYSLRMQTDNGFIVRKLVVIRNR